VSIAIHAVPESLATTSETRVAAYLPAGYVERRAVTVIFGLTRRIVCGMLEALATGRPTVVQAPMENAPAPGATADHWNINGAHRQGR